MVRLLLVSLVFHACWCATLPAQAPLPVSRLAPGAHCDYELVLRRRMAAGPSLTSSFEIRLVVRWTARGPVAADGTQPLEATIRRATGTSTSFLGVQTFDTAKTDANPMDEMLTAATWLRPLVDQPIRWRLGTDGTVSSLTVPDALRAGKVDDLFRSFLPFLLTSGLGRTAFTMPVGKHTVTTKPAASIATTDGATTRVDLNVEIRTKGEDGPTNGRGHAVYRHDTKRVAWAAVHLHRKREVGAGTSVIDTIVTMRDGSTAASPPAKSDAMYRVQLRAADGTPCVGAKVTIGDPARSGVQTSRRTSDSAGMVAWPQWGVDQLLRAIKNILEVRNRRGVKTKCARLRDAVTSLVVFTPGSLRSRPLRGPGVALRWPAPRACASAALAVSPSFSLRNS